MAPLTNWFFFKKNKTHIYHEISVHFKHEFNHENAQHKEIMERLIQPTWLPKHQKTKYLPQAWIGVEGEKWG